MIDKESPKLESRSYEPFDPEAELKNIRKFNEKASLRLADRRSETRAEKLEEYKKELIRQKEGMAKIQEDLEKRIRENPDLSQEKLMETVLAEAPEYKLSENQLALFKETLNKYVERHQAVREARKQYPHDKELFKACFGKEPTGFVEIVERPASLYFRCDNLHDYAWVYKTKFLSPKQEQNITMNDIKSADRTGGFCLTIDCLIPSLKYAITVEKVVPPNTSRPKSEEILKHEEQHSIYRLFKQQRIQNSIERTMTEPKIREKIAQELKNEKSPKILINYLRAVRENFENSAKDEILAFYKSGRPLHEAIDWLLKTQGLLDYFYQNKDRIYETLQKQLAPDLVRENKTEIKKILNQVFVDEYRQKIFDNAYAIRILEKMGKSRDEIVHLLTTEPLSRWGKLVKRINKVKT